MKGCSKKLVNGWTVYRVHYSADPAKDPDTEAGRAWLENEKKGYSNQQWRAEYEIDYRARYGQPVFPEFDENIHACEPFEIDPKEWTAWMGVDPHPRTAHAFLWLLVNKHGRKIITWSWWPEYINKKRMDEGRAYLTVKDYAEYLKEEFWPSYLSPEPYRAVMDVAGRAFNASEGVDYFKKYCEEGIYFLPAKKNRDYSGYGGISQELKIVEETGEPNLMIWRGMGDNDELIAQIRDLRWREHRGTVTDKDAPEEPEQKRRHLVDCLSYALLDGPCFVESHRSTWKPIYPKIGY